MCFIGEAYRFTLQPVFLHVLTEWRCHVRQVRSDVLFQLWFYVTVAKSGFETPRIFVTVRRSDVASPTSGRFQFEFIAVEYRSGLHTDADLILTGRLDHTDSGWDYVTSPARPTTAAAAGDNGESILPTRVHGIPNSVFILSAEFSEPFAYSTSTWVGPEGSCEKDASAFRPAGSWSSAAEEQSERVSVVVQKPSDRRSGPFLFAVKSIASPPFMRFTVPGGVQE